MSRAGIEDKMAFSVAVVVITAHPLGSQRCDLLRSGIAETAHVISPNELGQQQSHGGNQARCVCRRPIPTRATWKV